MPVQEHDFRIYAFENCKYCEAAKEQFAAANVPLQVVVVDRLLEQGIVKALNLEHLELPIVMNYFNGELLPRYDREVIDGWLNLYTLVRDSVPRNPDNAVVNSEAPETVSQ